MPLALGVDGNTRRDCCHASLDSKILDREARIPYGGGSTEQRRPQMTDYPPGVSGNEPEIVGWQEHVEYVSCNLISDLVVVPAEIAEEIAATARQVERSTRIVAVDDLSGVDARRRVRVRDQQLVDLAAAVAAFPTTYASCPFVGDRIVRSAPGLVSYWTCPICSTVHEWEDEPDVS
jgi:hypothetical protein